MKNLKLYKRSMDKDMIAHKIMKGVYVTTLAVSGAWIVATTIRGDLDATTKLIEYAAATTLELNSVGGYLHHNNEIHEPERIQKAIEEKQKEKKKIK